MMIHYSSPTLCGIKPGNLFSVKTACFSRPVFKKWEREYAGLGLSVSVIEKSGITKLVLVYNRRWVQNILAESSVQTYLATKGYRTDSEVQEIIKDLTDRIKPDTLFPHEIGIILGYPVEDVIAFEKHQGQQCKYCGYWKSYSDVDKARKCQCSYKRCSGMCRKMFDAGYSVHQIIKNYKERYAT